MKQRPPSPSTPIPSMVIFNLDQFDDPSERLRNIAQTEIDGSILKQWINGGTVWRPRFLSGRWFSLRLSIGWRDMPAMRAPLARMPRMRIAGNMGKATIRPRFRTTRRIARSASWPPRPHWRPSRPLSWFRPPRLCRCLNFRSLRPRFPRHAGCRSPAVRRPDPSI